MVANYRPLRAPVYFTCLAQSSDPDLGTVTGSGKYLAGKTVTLTAHPGERADFAGWMDEEGQLVSQESRYSFSITQDIILTAQFVRIYAVLVSVEPEGSGTVQGAGNYRQGQEAVLAAQESEGWLFTAWTEQGETVEASPEYRFVVDRDRTLAARFAVRCIITLLPGLEGAGTATGAGAYPYGAKVTLTASPAEGYRFLGWQNAAGETVSTAPSYSFPATEDAAFTPLFEAYASPLPVGYYELEYIENPNLGYLDAALAGGNLRQKEFYAKLSLPSEDITGTLLGGQNNGYYKSGSSYRQYCYANRLDVTKENGRVEIDLKYGYTAAKSSPPQSAVVQAQGTELEVQTDFDTYLTVNGVRQSINRNTNTLSTVSYPSFNGILSYSYRYQYSATGFTNYKGQTPLNCKLYALRLGELQFLPAQDPAGSVGLYELSTGTFCPSSKEDAPFLAGPIVAAGTT